MMKNDHTNLISLKGLVIPSEWDKDGNVTGVTIAGNNEMEYPILMNRVGKRLTGLLHKIVVIEGRKTKTDNIDIIEVQKFSKDII